MITASIHHLLDLVLESMRSDDLDAICKGQPLAPQELAALRDGFIAAGCAALETRLSPEAWAQVNIGFGAGSEAFLAGHFYDSLRGWIASGAVRQFCFTLKPPGMRLRFYGDRASLLGELSSAFELSRRCGQIAEWSCGRYDAEPYQFGGPVGSAIAHRFFTAESLAVFGFHRLRAQGGASLDPPLFSLLLIEVLLRAATGDAWERWDVWRRMELTGRAPEWDAQTEMEQLDASREARQFLAGALETPGDTISRASAAERRIFDEYSEPVPAVAADLRRAHETGQLLWGMREILPFWIVFHWNRMGFDLTQQRRMTFLMSTLLSPHPDAECDTAADQYSQDRPR